MVRKVIDLSSKVASGIPVFYSATGLWGLAHTVVSDFDTYEGTAMLKTHGKVEKLYRTRIVTMCDHGSTHVDAVYHINAHGDTIDRVPVDRLCGEGVLLDYHEKKPPGYDPFKPAGQRVLQGDWITVESLEKAAEKVGGIKKGNVVLFRTDASKKLPSWEYCHNVIPFRIEAIKWLLDHGVTVLGVDQASIDIAPDYLYPHEYLREAEFFHFENLTNLDKIPKPRFRFVAYPLKWEDGSASPVRCLAIVEE
jgi:kynurenine formamidase